MQSYYRPVTAIPAFAALGFLLLALVSWATPPHTVTEEVLNARIGKWQLLSLQWISHPPHEGGSLVLDLIEGTHDRDGQGVYTGAMRRLLHASGDQVTVSLRDANTLVVDLAFDGVSGPSRIQFAARVSGPEDNRTARLDIQGQGPVFELFKEQLTDVFNNADRANSLRTTEWTYQPPETGTTMPLAPVRKPIPLPVPRPIPDAKP